MTLHKFHGLANPADLVTKYLDQHAASKHLKLLDMWMEGGQGRGSAEAQRPGRARPADEPVGGRMAHGSCRDHSGPPEAEDGTLHAHEGSGRASGGRVDTNKDHQEQIP